MIMRLVLVIARLSSLVVSVCRTGTVVVALRLAVAFIVVFIYFLVIVVAVIALWLSCLLFCGRF